MLMNASFAWIQRAIETPKKRKKIKRKKNYIGLNYSHVCFDHKFSPSENKILIMSLLVCLLTKVTSVCSLFLT